MIDIDTLLKEVSTDVPSGENLEYDPAFTELERFLQGKPEQAIGNTVIPAEPPKWSDVQEKILNLFPRTKDLRLATHLLRSLVETGGLIGLEEGLSVLRGLITQHWDTIHPQLDPTDNNDPLARINILISLCDPETMLRSVRKAPLVVSKVIGQFSLRDIEIASEGGASSGNDGDPPLGMSSIDAAFTDCALESLQITAKAVTDGMAHINEIESYVIEKVGEEKAPSFKGLMGVLKEIKKVLSEQLGKHGVGDGPVAEDKATTSSVPLREATPMTGQINSREDVFRLLDKIIAYYKKNEPSSPVPLLLKRAKQLISKDFMEILQDLVPTGVSQAKIICGENKKK